MTAKLDQHQRQEYFLKVLISPIIMFSYIMHLFKHLQMIYFEPYFKLLAMSVYEKDRYFSPWSEIIFQSAITCAYTSSLLKHSIQVKSGQIIPFDFYNFYAAARSLLGICFEFCVVYLSWLLHRSGSTRGSWVQSVAYTLPWCYKNGGSSRIIKMRSMSAQWTWRMISLALILEYIK